jgi:hypothetical protein
MGLFPVGGLEALTCGESENAAVLELGHELALENEQDMTFAAPMIGPVIPGAFDQPDSDVAELSCPPKCVARLARDSESARRRTNPSCRSGCLTSSRMILRSNNVTRSNMQEIGSPVQFLE